MGTLTRTTKANKRAGLTLVEMLVSVALVMFVMILLSEAFSKSLTAFRQLRALGDLQARLRTVNTMLRRDLTAKHFEFEGPNRGVLLKDQVMTAEKWEPPTKGYVRIWQLNPSITEGVDGDLIPSSRATTHLLSLSVSSSEAGRFDNRLENYVTGLLPARDSMLRQFGPEDHWEPPGAQNRVYNSHWYEVAYFLRQPPGNPTANGTPLLALYRRQRPLLSSAHAAIANTTSPRIPFVASPVLFHDQDYLDISCKQDPAATGFLYFNGPEDITAPFRRFGVDQSAAGLLPPGVLTYPTLGEQVGAVDPDRRTGDDLLLYNVISFEVKVLLSGSSDFIDVPPAPNPNPGLQGQRILDTWCGTDKGFYNYSNWNDPNNSTATRIPQLLHVLAVQIVIRIWDEKTEQTRQVTIISEI